MIVLAYLASNVREKYSGVGRGLLFSMLAQATLNKKELTIEVAESILGVMNQGTEKGSYR